MYEEPRRSFFMRVFGHVYVLATFAFTDVLPLLAAYSAFPKPSSWSFPISMVLPAVF